MSGQDLTRRYTQGEINATRWKCLDCGARATPHTMDATYFGEATRRYLVTRLECTAAVCSPKRRSA